MAPSPDPRHGPRCVLPAGGFSGPGTALGTAGGQEWGAISCAPYPHPGLLDWVDRRWTTSTGFQSDHSSRSGGRKPPDFRLLTGRPKAHKRSSGGRRVCARAHAIPYLSQSRLALGCGPAVNKVQSASRSPMARGETQASRRRGPSSELGLTAPKGTRGNGPPRGSGHRARPTRQMIP